MDLLAPEIVQDPYPIFKQLREESPVLWSQRHRAWLVTRFDDVTEGYRDLSFSSEHVAELFGEGQDPASQRVLDGWMEFRDPPAHTRLRKLVQKAFTPKVVESLKPRIAEIAAELLAELDPTRPADLVSGFAYPLPATVIAEMLGVPATDRARFRDWSDQIKDLIFGIGDEAERRVRARKGLAELRSYFEDVLAELARKPREGLLNSLAEAKEAGDRLSADEVIGTCVLLLFAGHETTTNLIANGILVLADHPEVVREMTEKPEDLPSVVEEILRFDGPLKLMVRLARQERELRGQKIRPGDRVFLIQAAANRDPLRFEEPDRFDITRRDRTHVAFGHGIHFCLGAPLARVEGQIALGELFRRHPNLRIESGKPSWQASILSRSLEELPVTLAPPITRSS